MKVEILQKKKLQRRGVPTSVYKHPSNSWLIPKLYMNCGNSKKHKKKRAAGKLKD